MSNTTVQPRANHADGIEEFDELYPFARVAEHGGFTPPAMYGGNDSEGMKGD